MGLAEEGEEVVLAHREDLDVLDHHHLVVGDGEQGLVEAGLEVEPVAAGQEAQGLLDPIGGLEEALAIGVLAEAGEDGADVVAQRVAQPPISGRAGPRAAEWPAAWAAW